MYINTIKSLNAAENVPHLLLYKKHCSYPEQQPEVDLISYLKPKAALSPAHIWEYKKKKKIYSCGLVSDTSVNLRQLKMVSLWGKPLRLQSDPAASSLVFVWFKTGEEAN